MTTASTASIGRDFPVRTASVNDLALLPAVEAAADRLFDGIGRGPLPPAGSVADLVDAACILVAGMPPVGFARSNEASEFRQHRPDHGRIIETWQ